MMLQLKIGTLSTRNPTKGTFGRCYLALLISLSPLRPVRLCFRPTIWGQSLTQIFSSTGDFVDIMARPSPKLPAYWASLPLHNISPQKRYPWGGEEEVVIANERSLIFTGFASSCNAYAIPLKWLPDLTILFICTRYVRNVYWRKVECSKVTTVYL